jgi:hypothetical protein
MKKPRIEEWYRVFADVDYAAENEIPIDDFFEYYGLETTHFTRRAFAMYASTYTGKLNFPEFILSAYNYCTSDFESLVCRSVCEHK